MNGLLLARGRGATWQMARRGVAGQASEFGGQVPGNALFAEAEGNAPMLKEVAPTEHRLKGCPCRS